MGMLRYNTAHRLTAHQVFVRFILDACLQRQEASICLCKPWYV